MKHTIFIILICLLTACSNNVNFDDSIFDEVVYAPRYATGFKIRRHNDSGATLITSSNPWQGAEGVAYKLLIDPNNHFSTSANIQRINADPKRIICMSSSHIAMLEAIDQVTRVVGVSGIDFISSDYITDNRHTIGDVGYDNNINYELLIALNPDLVLLYGINTANSVEQKLRELNIPFAYIGEYVESSPLGKAEWLVAVGEIVGSRECSIETFNSIEQRYNTVKERVEKHIDHNHRPKVMLNIPYRDSWFLPAKSSYVVQLIEDAGGDTFTTDGEGNASAPIDIEQAILYATQSHVWLNPSGCNTIAELVALNPKFADAPPVVSGNVWNNNARQTPMGGSDFWESGVVCPDIILQDLANIFHPELEQSHEPHSLFYYKQLR
ncbi:MAG: ABC transporter substrate-binding protein [Alistipes sp.]|nr:ABC transporter substrate-binding protein [Alistipes sp.]